MFKFILKKITRKENGKNQSGKRRKIVSYVEGNSLLHILDPRTKFFVLIVFGFVSLYTDELIPMMLLFMLVVVAAIFSDMFRYWLQLMKRIVPFLFMVLVLDMLFPKVSYGPIFYSAQIWKLHPEITWGGMVYSLAMGLRLLIFVGSAFLFITSTKYEDFVKALRKLKVPYTFSFSLGLALRSTTYLSSDVRNIMDAQRSRGLEFDKGSIFQNSNKLLSLFIPLIVCLLGRSKSISESMPCRGFGYAKNPTMYSELKFKNWDYIFAGLTVIIGSVLIWQY